jgi:hypothetical protein
LTENEAEIGTEIEIGAGIGMEAWTEAGNEGEIVAVMPVVTDQTLSRDLLSLLDPSLNSQVKVDSAAEWEVAQASSRKSFQAGVGVSRRRYMMEI